MGTAGVFRSAVRDWRVVAGLSIMYVWTWLHYWGGAYSLRAFTIEVTNARWTAHVLVCALAVGAALAMALRLKGPRILAVLRTGSLASGLIGTGLALFLMLATPADGGAVMAVALLSGVFTGVCEGFLLTMWCTLTSAPGMRTALVYNVLAMVVSGLLFVVCNAVPTPVALGLGMLLPVAGHWCALSRSRVDREGAFAPAEPSGRDAGEGRSTSGAPASPRARVGALLRDRSFAMLGAIAFVFGCSCGFINASFEVVPEELYRASCHIVVVGTICAAALTYLTAFVLKMDGWQLVFRTSLPLMAVAYLLFPYEGLAYVGPGVHALGYQYFFITFWSLLGSQQLRRDVPAVCAVPLGLLLTEAGSALGLLLWNTLCAGIDARGLNVVSSVAALVILIVAVSFEKPAYGWGNVRPGTPAVPAAQDMFAAAIERIRAERGLSPRETDVCARLGRGRNRQVIADELGISLETAKTHATNVYRKLGVHSQQELLDVIEMTCDTLAREAANS